MAGNRQWFIEKIAQNPEYLQQTYLPELDRELVKALGLRDEAIRKDDIYKLKYLQGWLDGVSRIHSLIDGLRLSESRTPSEPGLMARMFSFGSRDRSETPADLG